LGRGILLGVPALDLWRRLMDSAKTRQILEQRIRRINAKLESIENPARRKKLRKMKWALKARLRGN
jgi:hypothetical protein